ncbi:MAG: MFS transporter [Actinobacteria bacterium]|nr:MAG: MFS transporter [Actinomycetota bacterium]
MVSAIVPLRRNRDFVLLQTGQALSTVGSEAAAVAYTLLVLSVTHSPAKAGLVGFVRLAPWPLLALPAGVAVDRWNRKHLMIVADVARVVAVGALGVAAATGHVTFPLIAVVAFVEGAMYVLFNIAEIGAVRSVVASEQLPRAFATEQARLSSVYLAGPPLGGLLFGLGRSLPFIFDAISYAFSTGSLLAMRTPFQEEREATAKTDLRAEVKEGLTWLWSHTFLRMCALLFAAGNFTWGALELTIIVAARREGFHPFAIGALIAVIGALSLAGSIAAPRFHGLLSMRTTIIAASWLALGIGSYLAKPSVYVLLAGGAPSVFFGPTLNAMIIGYRVRIVPDRLQGRVNSVARSLALVALPLGPVVAGVLLGAFSARATVLFLFVWLVALAIVTTASRTIRAAPDFHATSVAVS